MLSITASNRKILRIFNKEQYTNNISEGFGRYEKLDKTRFYKISRGSCYELVNQSLASHALSYISDNEKDELTKGYRAVIDDLDPMIKSIETTKRK